MGQHTAGRFVRVVFQVIRNRSYIIELIQVGDYVKVSAVDPDSGVEACIVGARTAGEAALQRMAVRKLEYVLAKRHGKLAAGPVAAG